MSPPALHEARHAFRSVSPERRGRKLFLLVIALLLTTKSMVALADPEDGDRNCSFGELVPIADIQLPAETEFQGYSFGGISGVDFGVGTGQWLMISDDRQAPRIFAGELNINPDGIHTFNLVRIDLLRDTQGEPFAAPDQPGPSADAESIRIESQSNTIYWASEGNAAKGSGPELFRIDTSSGDSEAVQLPTALVRDARQAIGPRDNRSLESISLSTSRNWLWLAMEAPLLETGVLPDASQGAIVPVYKLNVRSGRFKEFFYPVEKARPHQQGAYSDNGVSEVLESGRDQLLVLERSGSRTGADSYTFTSRLYCAVRGNAKDPLLQKSLVFDFSELGTSGYANFEGMAFGPRLSDGRRSLVVASDNNFDVTQPTHFIVFAINEVIE